MKKILLLIIFFILITNIKKTENDNIYYEERIIKQENIYLFETLVSIDFEDYFYKEYSLRDYIKRYPNERFYNDVYILDNKRRIITFIEDGYIEVFKSNKEKIKIIIKQRLFKDKYIIDIDYRNNKIKNIIITNNKEFLLEDTYIKIIIKEPKLTLTTVEKIKIIDNNLIKK